MYLYKALYLLLHHWNSLYIRDKKLHSLVKHCLRYICKVLNTSGTQNHSAFGPTNLSLSPLHPGPLQGSSTTWVQSAHNVHIHDLKVVTILLLLLLLLLYIHPSLNAQLRSNLRTKQCLWIYTIYSLLELQ